MTSPTSPAPASNGGQEAPISVQLQGGCVRETVNLRAPVNLTGKRSTIDALRDAAANFVSRKVKDRNYFLRFDDAVVRAIGWTWVQSFVRQYRRCDKCI